MRIKGLMKRLFSQIHNKSSQEALGQHKYIISQRKAQPLYIAH